MFVDIFGGCMKKLIALMCLFSFTVGLNATITKEELYNASPAQFDQLKRELNTLNAKETEKLKKSFENKEINEAVKAIFSNKDILKNNNYALIRNGKIIKIGNAKDADGISFWHIPEASLANPVENTCVINDPQWSSDGSSDMCGHLAYKMDQTSPYASLTERLKTPQIYLLPDMQFSDIEALFPDEIASTDQTNALDALSINVTIDSETHPARETAFESFQTVYDTTPALGWIDINTQYNTIYLYKPMAPKHKIFSEDKISAYYRETEFIHPNPSIAAPIYTLKSGNYMQLFMLAYNATDNWWEGQYILFKWINVRVENYYLGDVGINNYTLNDCAKISWNNHLVSIDFEDVINPKTVTYELYDIAGKLIQTRSLSSHHSVISVPAVANGIYIVRVRGKNLDLSKRISIVK